MEMSDSRCPVCDYRISRWVMAERGYDIVECPLCRLVYVWPRPNSQDLELFYEGRYADSWYDSAVAEWGREISLRRFSRYVKPLIERKASGRLLDVGCGYGFFLELMRPRGYETYGLDLNPKSVRYCNEVKNVDVRLGRIGDDLFPPGYFDIVTMWMVLEHVPDPGGAIAWARRLLRPGGIICIQVPNINSARTKLVSFLSKDGRRLRPLLKTLRISANPGLLGPYALTLLDPPHHLQGFNVRALKELLLSQGFCDFAAYPAYTDRVKPLENWARLAVFAPFLFLSVLNHEWQFMPSLIALGRVAGKADS